MSLLLYKLDKKFCFAKDNIKRIRKQVIDYEKIFSKIDLLPKRNKNSLNNKKVNNQLKWDEALKYTSPKIYRW